MYWSVLLMIISYASHAAEKNLVHNAKLRDFYKKKLINQRKNLHDRRNEFHYEFLMMILIIMMSC